MSDGEARSAMERALAARSTGEAWAALEPLRPRLGEDRDVATAWVALLQASPSAPHLREDAELVAAKFASDAGLVAGAATTLVRAADRDGPDAPSHDPTLASRALEIVEARLASLTEAERRDPDVAGVLEVARGNALRRLGRDELAIAALETAVKLEGRGDWLFDLGRVHLWARRFRAALVAFDKAREKLAGARRTHFAVGVAATGAGDAERAGEAWRALGMDVKVEPGRPPLVEGLGPVLVRLPIRAPHAESAGLPDASVAFEEVRVERFSPCHGVVVSATRGDAVADAGDVVLFDVAPLRPGTIDGARVPVLPLLAVLTPGDERRFRVIVLEQEEGQAAAFLSSIEGAQFVEHERRIETVCPRCASGDVLTKHEHLPAEPHRAVLGKLVVRGDTSLETLAAALAKKPAALLLAIPALHEALGHTAEAGKHHKTWGVIERGVRR